MRNIVRPLLFVTILVSFLSLTAASNPRPNVLLISIDTLRSDHLGCYGYSTPTPAIDAFAKKSALFETAISQVPLTLPSHCTILTGLYPDQHGVRNNESFILPSRMTTLAELLLKNGYSTGAIVGSFSLDSGFGVNQGFQYYEDQIGTGHDAEINRHAERRAETVWKLGKEWLNKQKSPWFCFLHFFDPHTAYAPPKPYPQTYDGEIAYVDRVIGEIWRELEQRNLLSTTIIVLLSDHGESLGEHGELDHGVFLYDATLKVPLLISAPGLSPVRIRSQVRLADVGPTIAELSGIPWTIPSGGQSLVPILKGNSKELPAYSETYYTNLLMGWAPLHSMRWSAKKWIDAPKAELYNLTDDPKEFKNIYTSSSVPTAVRGELQKHLETRSASASATEVDPETREKLASLGYITGSSPTPVSSTFDPKDGIQVWTEIEQAVQFAQMEDYKKSEQLFLSALQSQPDNVMAQKFLANVYRKTGEPKKAIPYLEKAMQSKLHTADTRYELAETNFEMERYANALQILSPLLQEKPPNQRVFRLAAASALNAGKYEESARYFEAVLKENPSDSESLTKYARVLSVLKEDTKAIQAYEKLSSLRPLSEEEAIQVAAIYLTLNQPAPAEKYFQMAIGANPRSVPAWKGLALIRLSRNQIPEALEAFVQAGDCEQARNLLKQSDQIPPSILEVYKTQCP